MTIWAPDIESISGPRYQAIASAIGDAILAGDLSVGEKLPPHRELAWRLGVTVGTVSRGYALAELRGFVSGEVGRGTFVRTPQHGKSQLPSNRSSAILQTPDTGVINLGVNASMSPYHGEVLAETLGEISQAGNLELLLKYMPAAGHGEYRAAAAQWMSQLGIATDPDCVVLTSGAQEGIAAAFAVLLQPGSPMLCEPLTYTGVIDNARLFNHPLVGVEMDDRGIMPESLERRARESGARAVIIQPTVHNPTCVTMDLARRREIVDVAERLDLLIVEDDVYGMLPADRPPPIATLAPDRTIYLSSASKAIAPGLRAGWIVAPPAYVEQLIDAVFGMTCAMPGLMHEVLRRWTSTGIAKELIRRLRLENQARQSLAAEIFQGQKMLSDPAAFHVMLYLPPPWRREEFSDAALAQGVRVIPVSAFSVGQDSVPHAVRISLAAAVDQAELVDALSRLQKLIASEVSPRRAII